MKLLWQPLDVDQEWSKVKKGETMMFDYCVGRDWRIENWFWVKLPWSCFCVMGESILRFQCWIFRFCPSLCSIVHQVNACVCVFFHPLFYVVLIILLLFLYLLWSPLPVVFILLFFCRTAIFGVVLAFYKVILFTFYLVLLVYNISVIILLG